MGHRLADLMVVQALPAGLHRRLDVLEVYPSRQQSASERTQATGPCDNLACRRPVTRYARYDGSGDRVLRLGGVSRRDGHLRCVADAARIGVPAMASAGQVCLGNRLHPRVKRSTAALHLDTVRREAGLSTTKQAIARLAGSVFWVH